METIGTPLMWAAFAVFVIVALAVDLWADAHRRPAQGRPTAKPCSGARSGSAWRWPSTPACGGTCAAPCRSAEANRIATEFLTGYLVEKALAVDNIFVFLMLFNYFGVPAASQQRVLVYGVLGAIVLRAILIFVGAALIAKFHWLLYVFGLFLLATGVKMLVGRRQGAGPGEQSGAALDHRPPAADPRLPRRGAVDRRGQPAPNTRRCSWCW